jgi:hypothetical protein
MTEAEWISTRAYAQGMMWHLRGSSLWRTKRGRRTLRLFAVACCRQFSTQLWDDRLRQAIDVAERVAEGHGTKQELEHARRAVEPLNSSSYSAPLGHGNQERTATSLVNALTLPGPYDAALSMTCYELPLAGYCGDIAHEHALMCDLVRDIFGNPFRPVSFHPAWRTDTAVSLARQMYDSRDFGAMPILADALQDAGCDSEEVLTHCRDANQPHVRGCWVCDLVLGKA